MRTGTKLIGSLTLIVAAGVAGAAEHGCTDPRAHDFDFWIGTWEVANTDGSIAGGNRIEPILDGCVLQETWTGRSGSAGTSLNFFDTERRQWRQFWVWREGTTLELAGGLVDGAMILEGDSVEDGKPARNRITWTKQPDASVRQLWQLSRDDGKSWTTLFDGTYRPLK
jgi:hypothetical protein